MFAIPMSCGPGLSKPASTSNRFSGLNGTSEPVTPDFEFMARMAGLGDLYLSSEDPETQSGFGGGRARWIAERSPLMEAIDRDGDFLDVGCANGLLAADVVSWAAGRGVRIVPHGVDLGEALIDRARDRHADRASNFVAADAWQWRPSRQWTYVYSLLNLAPTDLSCAWLRRLLEWVEPGGRLIIGSYGSRSRNRAPLDVAQVVRGCGLAVAGLASGGDPPITRFAWVVKPLPT